MTVREELKPNYDGDNCKHEDCNGYLVREKVENCSCHINTPCNACLDAKLECSVCGEQYDY